MYLMDNLNQFAAKLAYAGATDPALRGYLEIVRKLHGTPRFLLDPNATRTAVELNLGRPKILREAMEHLVIPYRRMWVEWDDGDRQRLRDKFEEKQDYSELRPMPGRVGFLLEADETGRRGTALWAWTTPGNPVGNVGAVQPYYDLDRVHPLPPEREEGLLKGNLGKIWEHNPVQLEALLDIWRTCEHVPSAWGPALWELAPNPELFRSLSYSDTVGEYIMIWGVLMMLTASRQVVNLTPVDLGKLNKHRTRRGETPLYDYTRVSLYLQPQAQRPVIRGELGYSRKSPRIHVVSSYLARRGTRHWIVQPYFRGSGETIHRVVNVRG